MSLSSFSSLSSYSSESDIGTIFGIGLFKSSRPRRRSRQISDRKRTPSPPRRRKRSITPTPTPTRTPVSTSRYDGVIVPYSLRSPGSKSGISYSDIDRWRTATVGGSDFTYSSESSITQSSVTSSSVVSSSRSRSSRIEVSSRRTVASTSRQLEAPSVVTRPPHSGIHFDPPQICEHCHRPPHQVHGRTDVLPALRLEPYSAFLAAYRLSRISCPDALERSTTLDQDDPFAIPSGLSERPNVPPHLLPEVPTGERRARRLALLLDSDDQDIRDWAQAEYLKLGRAGRRLVREGVFEVRVALDGADDDNPAEDWSANEDEEDLEKLKEKLERGRERREDREEVEREMVWAREVFGKWLVDGRLDAVFRLSASVLNEFLKEVARDEGEEWVADGEEEKEEDAEEDQSSKDTKVPQKSPGPSSVRGTSQTIVADQAVPTRAASAASVASSKRSGKRRSEPFQKAEPESDMEPKPVPAPEPVPMLPPVQAPEPEVQSEASAEPNPPPAPSHADPSPEPSPLPVPVPLPVLHPSIFSEEGLLTYAYSNIHPDPPPELSPPADLVRPESQQSNSNNTITPQDYPVDTTAQHDSYADFFAKDPRRRRTPLLRVKPLPNNQPLPKPEREYDSYADFFANDPRRMKHVDDRPLPALVKKDATKSADRSSKPPLSSKPPKLAIPSKAPPQSSSSKPPKLSIPSKAPPDPPRLTESKHRRRSHSRHRRRRDPSPSLDDFAISSNLSASSGGLTTPCASDIRSRSPSPPRDREHRHSSRRKSGHKPHRPSSGLTSPTPSQSGRRRDSRSRRDTPPLPIPASTSAPKPTPPPAPKPKPKRSWVAPFRLSGGAASVSTAASSSSRPASPEPTPIRPRGAPYAQGPRPLIPTSTMASDAGDPDGRSADPAEAVVPPEPPLPPVQFWLPGYPAYKLDHARANGGGGDGAPTSPRRHRGEPASPSSSTRSSAQSLLVQQRPPPPVFLALGARRACVPYTPAFQGVDLRVVRPLSAREKLAMRDAVSVLVRLGARVIGAEAGGLGVRGEMWSLSYVGF